MQRKGLSKRLRFEVFKRDKFTREQFEAFNAFLSECREWDTQLIERLGRYWFNKVAQEESEIDQYVFGPGRVPTIKRFIRLLPEAKILEAMDIAEGRIFVFKGDGEWKRWKYFCGICWRMIREPWGQ